MFNLQFFTAKESDEKVSIMYIIDNLKSKLIIDYNKNLRRNNCGSVI